MLGAIIGDIVGSRFEFHGTNDYDFELFTDRCGYTDDSICTIAVADAIVRGIDYGESLHDWCRKYPHPMGGYGGRFAAWVHSDDPKPYGSFGNGSAMRVSPVGWWFTGDDVLEEAKKTAECTHNHKAGIEGAQAVAIAISDCLAMFRHGGQTPNAQNIAQALARAKQFYWGDSDIDFNIEQYRNRFDETCQGTVPPALWIVAHSTSFEDAIRQAVSLGADADTIGAIVGSIAEAIWPIPEPIKTQALSRLPQDMLTVLTTFRTHLHKS